MDTVYSNQQCLLWTLLIILAKPAMEVASQCPQGQLQHWQTAAYSQPPYMTCCYPTRCSVGQEVQPCTVNGTHDTCQMCGHYKNQSLRTSSFTMEPCTDWPLDVNCMSSQSLHMPSKMRIRNTTDTRTQLCMCNIEQGMKFVPPEYDIQGAPMDSYCQRRSQTCKPGHEPVVLGDCQPCQVNYFKTTEGFKLCEPKTNCSMLGLRYVYFSTLTTADNNCSQPDPVTTPKMGVPETPMLVTTTQKSSSLSSTSATTPPPPSTEDIARYGLSRDLSPDENGSPMPIIISVVVVFLVALVIFIAVIMFWRKKKGLSVWVCASAKNNTDSEKNYGEGSNSLDGNHRHKLHLKDGHIPQLLTDTDKIINNNINGGMPYSLGYLPNGHSNGHLHHAHFNNSEHNNGDPRTYFAQQYQYNLVPASRPGILRNTNRGVVHGQSHVAVRDRSIDSIGQEKLQVHVDELEANQDVGECDPLLVPDPRGTAPCQNLAATVGNSPPLLQAGGINQMQILTLNGRANFCPTFVHNAAPSAPLPPLGISPAATYAPAAGVVTFTRSTSVIASPEGEVDEDEIEARIPRLSQLLNESESSSAVESGQNTTDLFRADSAARETTQQLRAPSQRLVKNQYGSPRAGTTAQQQPHPHDNVHTHARPGLPPTVVGPMSQTTQQPDHCIMNLKEQQLSESLQSTLGSRQPSREPEFDLSATDIPKTVWNSPEEAQQTQLKTHLGHGVEGDIYSSAAAETKATKTDFNGSSTTAAKQFGVGRNTQNTLDKKNYTSGSNTLEKKQISELSDRRLLPRAGNNSNSGTLERQRVPSGENPPGGIKNSEDIEANGKKQHHCNRTVSFEEEEIPGQTQSKPIVSSERPMVETRYRGPLRSISDPEQKHLAESDDEETKRKCVSLEYNASNSSSKTSVNSDKSGTDSNCSSPTRTAFYRRSQSENATASSSDSHKPPPRSMSEEKAQKLDRPVAKVKPMPASDNAVNQLPSELSEDGSPAPVTGSTAQLPHHSDESDHEDHHETLHSSTLEEDEENLTEEEVEENNV